MQLLRSSKAKPETKGQDTRLERPSYLKGLDAANHHRASGVGRRVFLTSPLIEQGIARFDHGSLTAIAIYRLTLFGDNPVRPLDHGHEDCRILLPSPSDRFPRPHGR